LHIADQVAAREGVDQGTALMRVLVARLRDMSFPERLHVALDRAERHWFGGPEDLDGEKALVWEYVKTNYPAGDDVGSPDGRAARALLCVLYPIGDIEDRTTTAEWFAALVDNDGVGF
jgi:hypothetical protein